MGSAIQTGFVTLLFIYSVRCVEAPFELWRTGVLLFHYNMPRKKVASPQYVSVDLEIMEMAPKKEVLWIL